MRSLALAALGVVCLLLAYFAGSGQGYADGYRQGKAEAEAHAPQAPKVQVVEVPAPFAVPGPVQIREVKVPEYIQITKVERVEIPVVVREYWLVKVKGADVEMEQKGELPAGLGGGEARGR